MTKTVEPESGVPTDGSGVVTYTINVKNTGDALASGVMLTDTLPIEVDFGDWEGLTMDQIRLRAPAELDHLRRSPDTFVFPNGESVADLVLRVRGFMARVIEAQEQDGTCCVVSHGGPLRAALLDALEIPLRNYWRLAIAHGSVSCLSHDGGGFALSLLGCMP